MPMRRPSALLIIGHVLRLILPKSSSDKVRVGKIRRTANENLRAH